ncbi:cytochrome C oxidase subunit IV family protein [Mycobacterium arosiense]|uniref:Prokaryotic cytochrome C oxidase subunit IV family protein n=1 Tax=Mycobacterium arosiense ATCC BAA-1401 = DSM 45069 TaxID=1265311 RepID=A0A1W9ZCF9_MYCAI|nr:cytochrome C oxidase subunit IV family protein [Mycobacterium arosiense]ORA11944.1 hypothetical protein BST14_17675 [Mycobacterium arosiense ATCC BAA-1401 = DSM 45069]
MRALVLRSATPVWLVLTGLTVLSWALGGRHDFSSGHHTFASLAIIVVTVFKVRLVGLYFMEVRDAPVWLRLQFEGFCTALFATLASVYFLA